MKLNNEDNDHQCSQTKQQPKKYSGASFITKVVISPLHCSSISISSSSSSSSSTDVDCSILLTVHYNLLKHNIKINKQQQQ